MLGSLGNIIASFLEFTETSKRLHSIIVRLWGMFPTKLKSIVLHSINPAVTLGALAVIIDPMSSVDDPAVLLGYHTYHKKHGKPWALLGGGLKKPDSKKGLSHPMGIPGAGIVREVEEEIGLKIEVVKLLSIDTDWERQTMDFYFACALKEGPPPKDLKLTNLEVSEIKWFKLSELPDNTFPSHKNFLSNVLKQLPRLPGVSWTANQEAPSWWQRFDRTENLKRAVLFKKGDTRSILATLVGEAREILNCEIVSLFVSDPPVLINGVDFALPIDINGKLILWSESHDRRGTQKNPNKLEIPLSPSDKKCGLTATLVKTRPLGRAIRLHGGWLHTHPHVKQWTDHDHLTGRTCHSLAAVTIVSQTHVLGILKAENKMSNGSEYQPFSPDDGYILEELAMATVDLLQPKCNDK